MSNAAALTSFAPRLLAWFDQHGRKRLPWQLPRTPYRVWLSEIMLQQTQVAAVIPYFERFVARFPDVTTLAAAESDEVMRYWAGLGYYARARNLHAAARQVVAGYGGAFPADLAALQALKGVGRSTAGAILAQAFDQPAAILDGNVKRVLCRWAGIDGHPAEAAVSTALWQLAQRLLPSQRAADYVQAQMDLGATCCTARKPSCAVCPLSADCVAYQQGRVAELPKPKPRKIRPHREAWLILAEDEQGRLLLEQRPGVGIWGGLWCPPVIPLGDDRVSVLGSRFGITLHDEEGAETIDHAFTHYDLSLHPLRGRAALHEQRVTESTPIAWHAPSELRQGILALPTPVARYFERHGLPAAPLASNKPKLRRRTKKKGFA